ncbi:MAG: hypothetical protein D4R38_03055 [Dehalococcoidia bacterium]|nr:MAG: hypothetical protein D4R38_03055 [Dehalococcoidia bacterium]
MAPGTGVGVGVGVGGTGVGGTGAGGTGVGEGEGLGPTVTLTWVWKGVCPPLPSFTIRVTMWVPAVGLYQLQMGWLAHSLRAEPSLIQEYVRTSPSGSLDWLIKETAAPVVGSCGLV